MAERLEDSQDGAIVDGDAPESRIVGRDDDLECGIRSVRECRP